MIKEHVRGVPVKPQAFLVLFLLISLAQPPAGLPPRDLRTRRLFNLRPSEMRMRIPTSLVLM